MQQMYCLQSHESLRSDQTYCVSQHEPSPILRNQEGRLTFRHELNIYSVFTIMAN